MQKKILCLVGASVVPFIIESVYLLFFRWAEPFTGIGDTTSFFLSLAAGLVFVFFLPTKALERILSALLYVPTAGFILFYYSLMVIGHKYNVWL